MLITCSNLLPFFKIITTPVQEKKNIESHDICVLNPIKAVAGGVIEITVAPPEDATDSLAKDRIRIETVQL